MFKKTKFLSIFFVAIMYLVGLIFAFSGDLVQQIQLVRNKNQINKKNQIETISISLSKWNEFENKHEIKLKNIFYDVVSHSISAEKVTLKVVKDHFENEVRVFFSQVFNKNKFPNSDKKKTKSLSNQINFESNVNWLLKNIPTSILVENFKSNFDLKTIAFIYLPQKPPSI